MDVIPPKMPGAWAEKAAKKIVSSGAEAKAKESGPLSSKILVPPTMVAWQLLAGPLKQTINYRLIFLNNIIKAFKVSNRDELSD